MAQLNEISSGEQLEFGIGDVGQQINFTNHYWDYTYQYQEIPTQTWNTPATNAYSTAFNYFYQPQNPTNYFGFSNWTPTPNQQFMYNLSAIPTNNDFDKVTPPEFTILNAAPQPKPLEKRPSIALMLSPLKVEQHVPTAKGDSNSQTPGHHGHRKRLSKQNKEVLKKFVLAEDFSKKFSDATRDIKRRVEKAGKTEFMDYQIRNLFLSMRREAKILS
uniref:BHLH domain-containing protein n=1 Tax=Caenorhabditis tropicalis TaxID=1561998 RepID=A0A1I7U9C2_9PELO